MWFQLEGFSLSPQLLLHCPLVEIPKCSTPHVPHVAHAAHHVTLHAFRVSAVVPGAPHQGLACTRRNTLENILVKLKYMAKLKMKDLEKWSPLNVCCLFLLLESGQCWNLRAKDLEIRDFKEGKLASGAKCLPDSSISKYPALNQCRGCCFGRNFQSRSSVSSPRDERLYWAST